MSENNRTISHSNKELEKLIIKLWELSQNTVATFSDLKNKSDELSRRNGTLEQLVGEKDYGVSKLLEDKAALEDMIREHEAKFTAVSDEIAALQATLEETKAELNEARAKADEYRDIEGRMTLLRQRVEHQENLLNEFEKEKIRSAELEKQNKQLAERIAPFEQVKQDLELAHKEISRKNLDLVERNNEITQFREKTAEFESQLIKLRQIEKKYSEILTQKDLADGELSVKDELISRLKNEFDELKYSHDLSQNLIEELRELQGSKISEISAENESLKNENNDLNKKISDLEFELQNLNSNFRDANSKIEDLNEVGRTRDLQIAELEEYRESYTFLKQRADELEQSNERSALIISNLQKDLEAKEAENDSLHLEKAEQSIRFEKLNGKFVGLLNLEENNRKSLKLSLDQKAELTTELDEKNDLISLLQEEKAKLSDELKIAEEKLEEFNEVESHLELLKIRLAELEKTEQQNFILQSKIDEVQSKIEHLNETLLLTDSKATAYENENKRLREKVNDFNVVAADFSKLQMDSVNYKKSVEIFKEKEASFERKLFEDRFKIESLHAELSNKSAELNRIIAMLNETSTERDAVARSRDSISAVSAGKDTLIDDFKKRIVELLANLNTSKEELNNRDQKINELKQIISKLSEESIEKEMELKKIDSKLQQLNAELEKARKKEQTPSLFDNAPGDREIMLESKVTSLSNTLTIKDHQLSQLRQRAESLEELLKTRYEHIKILESQIDDMAKRNQEGVQLEDREKEELKKQAEKYLARIIKLLDE